MDATIPFWLVEQCNRLRSQNDKDQHCCYSYVTNLNLNLRRLDAPMLEALCIAILDNRSLTTLNLTSSLAQNPHAVDQLADLVIKNNHPLKVLHLSYNRLQNLTRLSSALACNSNLQELHLDYNLIGPKDATVLSRALLQCKSLQILRLDNNSIGDAGCFAIVQALEVSGNDNVSGLRVLGLAKNGITENGGLALLNMLQTNKNTTLTQVELSHNHVSSTTRHLINFYCVANAHGRSLICCHQHNKNNNNNNASLPCSLWPTILHRLYNVNNMNRNDYITGPSLCYYFIKSRPDLFSIQDAMET